MTKLLLFLLFLAQGSAWAQSPTWKDIRNKPTDGVSVGDYCLTITGPGVAVLRPVSSCFVPDGSDMQLQFKDGTVFRGDPGLTYDKIAKALSVSGAVVAPKIVCPTGLTCYFQVGGDAQSCSSVPTPTSGINYYSDVDNGNAMYQKKTTGVCSPVGGSLGDMLKSVYDPTNIGGPFLKDPGASGLIVEVSPGVTRHATSSDYQAPLTVTTTGTSGPASLGSGVLNIPQYDAGAGSTPGVGRAVLTATWTAITDGGCQEQSATWTGITTSDTVAIGPLALPSGVTAGDPVVRSSNTVGIPICNLSGAQVTPGSLTMNGVLVTYTLTGSAVIDFPIIGDGVCVSLTFPLPGVVAGDVVIGKWPSSLEAGLVPQKMLALSTDTITAPICNWSGGPIDPASQTFGASIAK